MQYKNKIQYELNNWIIRYSLFKIRLKRRLLSVRKKVPPLIEILAGILLKKSIRGVTFFRTPYITY